MFSCSRHSAYLYDRGGLRKLGRLGPLTRVRWNRKRDDISTGHVEIASPDLACNKLLGMIEAGRVELVLFRGEKRVWEGPVTRVAYQGTGVEIEARDVMHYVTRSIMRAEYDSRYPNNEFVLDRIERIMDAEMARKEALNPAINVLPHVQYLRSELPIVDAGTAARTLPYEITVFDHIDNYAARGGIDYTIIGRAILFFDVDHKIGQTPMVTGDDFIGEPIITQYGMELFTRVVMTDGKGNHGEAGGVDPYYGELEVLHQAYDEDAAGADPEDIPSVAEMESQAQRVLSQSKRPPLVVRIPDNTTLNPNGVLNIDDLTPGVWIPLTANLPSRRISQMQKLDSMSVEENSGGEEIKVTLSPATAESQEEV